MLYYCILTTHPDGWQLSYEKQTRISQIALQKHVQYRPDCPLFFPNRPFQREIRENGRTYPIVMPYEIAVDLS